MHKDTYYRKKIRFFLTVSSSSDLYAITMTAIATRVLADFLISLHPIADFLDEVITRPICRVLSKTKGKVNGPDGAAAFFGINPSTLRNRMKKLGIDYGRKSTF